MSTSTHPPDGSATRRPGPDEPTPQAKLAHPHDAQTTILRAIYQQKKRFVVVACGRRFGKTMMGQILINEMAIQGRRTWWLAPTYRMAAQVWRDLKATLTDETGITISESEHRIDFHETGGMIAIRSTHYPDNLRGAGLDYAILDEAAFMDPRAWTEVIRPMLLESQGGALFLSTPFGRNWFWRMYQQGRDPDLPDWASFHFESWDNPRIPKSELEDVRQTTPERVWREEYLAEFLDDAGQVFRGINEAATAPTDATPQNGHRYIMGVDWGREGDYTCLAVIDATTAQMVALDRFNQIGWSFQQKRLKSLAKRWNVTVIHAEANSMGGPLIEELQTTHDLNVHPFHTTARSKPPLIEGLALAIEQRELQLLPDDVLLDELRSYTLERLPGGGFRYNAPPGMHDDTVIATAIAWHGVQNGGLRVDFA